MQVSQLDAARRQLQTAIELWVSDGDPVSVHTLAFAAYQIIHDLNRQRKGPPLLLDFPYVRPEARQEWVNAVKHMPNYFKHADGRKRHKPVAAIEFDDATNLPLLLFALMGLKALGEQLTPSEVAFNGLAFIKRPDLFRTDARLAQESLDAQTLDGNRKRPNKELFEELLLLARRHNARGAF